MVSNAVKAGNEVIVWTHFLSDMGNREAVEAADILKPLEKIDFNITVEILKIDID